MKFLFLVLLALMGGSSIVLGKPTGKKLGQPLAEEDAGFDVIPAERQANDAATKRKTVFGPNEDDTVNMRTARWEGQSGYHSFPLLRGPASFPGDYENAAMRCLYEREIFGWEGDIQLTEEQNQNVSGFNVAKNLWPRQRDGLVHVPVYLYKGFVKPGAIKYAILLINDWFQGCIKLHFCFPPGDIYFPFECDIWDHIEFVSSDGILLRKKKECNNWYAAVHLLFHSLGLWHEHNRRDRDNYVRVLTGNIREGVEDRFNINHNMDTFGVPYNPYSVMHYRQAVLAKPGLNSMEWAGELERYCNETVCEPMGTYAGYADSIMPDVQKNPKSLWLPRIMLLS